MSSLPFLLHASKVLPPSQVKELEQTLRRRNPNSLPALIYAAAAANGRDADAEAAKTSPPSRINALLERRVQRLEAELESHDDEAKRSLRAMEQQFHRIKVLLKLGSGAIRHLNNTVPDYERTNVGGGETTTTVNTVSRLDGAFS